MEAMLPVLLVVDHHSQSVAALVQRGASDDAQVVEREATELVDSEQDVARHLSDGLKKKKKEKLKKRK